MLKINANFKKGNDYWFSSIEGFAKENGYGLEAAGRWVTIARQQVLVLTENRDGAQPAVFIYDKHPEDSYKRIV